MKPGIPPDSLGRGSRERLLEAAIRLFSQLGYTGASVRHIARESGIREASLYNHFPSKQALYEAIIAEFTQKLLVPGYQIESAMQGPADRASSKVLQGAGAFFARVGPQERQIWRILMQEQFRGPHEGDLVGAILLDGPVRFFRDLLEGLQAGGFLKKDFDCDAGAQVLNGIFFTHSFRANLLDAHGHEMGSHRGDLVQVVTVFLTPWEDSPVREGAAG